MNCVTSIEFLSILRHGPCNFKIDGGFDNAKNLYHQNVGTLLDMPLEYQKIINGIVVEMTIDEKRGIDEQPENISYHPLVYPRGEMQEISSDGEISLNSSVCKVTGSNLRLTLADGVVPYQSLKIKTTEQINVTCKLKNNDSFTLTAFVDLMWYEYRLEKYWIVRDFTGLVY